MISISVSGNSVAEELSVVVGNSVEKGKSVVEIDSSDVVVGNAVVLIVDSSGNADELESIVDSVELGTVADSVDSVGNAVEVDDVDSVGNAVEVDTEDDSAGNAVK